MDGARAGAIAILSSNSTRRNPMPIKLLAIAANAQVFEHRLAFELDLPSVVRLVVDGDLHPSLEIDELGGKPDIQALDAVDF
jgi:hypothetical protein